MFDSIFKWIFKASIVGILFMTLLSMVSYWVFVHGGVQHVGLAKLVVIQSDQVGHSEGCDTPSPMSPGFHIIDIKCKVGVTQR